MPPGWPIRKLTATPAVGLWITCPECPPCGQPLAAYGFRKLIGDDAPMSLILWGPPGTGKTILAYSCGEPGVVAGLLVLCRAFIEPIARFGLAQRLMAGSLRGNRTLGQNKALSRPGAAT
jgi:hypothetical protein